MTAKRYVLLVIVLSITFIAVVGAAGGIILDPYNVFHAEHIRPNLADPNSNYIKMYYITENPDKFNAFLFGASKVGSIHTEKITGEKCYNMTYASGLPSEHLDNIKTFLANGVHIEKIYMGIDSDSYTSDSKAHINDPIRCPYEYLKAHPIHFVFLYMRPNVVLSSIPIFLRNFSSVNYAESFYQHGAWASYGQKGNVNLNAHNLKPSIGTDNLIDETLNVIKETKDLCFRNKIEFALFTNPVNKITYMASLDRGHLRFLEGLAEITEFYNFGGLNDITLSNDSFIDFTHYKAEIGDMIIEVICNGKKYEGLYEQGFGWKVNKDNINEFLNLPEISCKEI